MTVMVCRQQMREPELILSELPPLCQNCKWLRLTVQGFLIGHYHRIDDMNYAVRLEHIRDCDQGYAAFFVLKHNALAIVHTDPQLAALYRGEFCGPVAFFDLSHQVR